VPLLSFLCLGLGTLLASRGQVKKKTENLFGETTSKTLSYVDSFYLRVLFSSRIVFLPLQCNMKSYFHNVMQATMGIAMCPLCSD
jgi:hypothetical protein